MNKSEIVESLSERCKLGLSQAEDIVNLFVDLMRNAIKSGDRIEIRGFGSFVVKEYRSYEGRNPKTSERITVKPKRLPSFKVGKELRERLNAESSSRPLESSGGDVLEHR
jgi:integration host factor subunit beta